MTDPARARFRIGYLDGTSHEVAVTFGDLARMSQLEGADWRTRAESDPLAVGARLAWLASRHDDLRPPLDWDAFLDQVDWIEQVEASARPTVAAAGNGSSVSLLSPPEPTPSTGSTSIPVGH